MSVNHRADRLTKHCTSCGIRLIPRARVATCEACRRGGKTAPYPRQVCPHCHLSRAITPKSQRWVLHVCDCEECRTGPAYCPESGELAR